MKKNIDKLFKENFNNQEIAPPEMVWTNIERELKKKKEKKIIPIWWKYSGVAAILLIGIFIGKEFFGSTENNSVPVNTVEVSSNSNSNIESNKNAKIPEISNDKEVLVSNSNDKNDTSNEINFQNRINSNVEKSIIVSNDSASRAQSIDKLNENIIANESNSRKEKSEIAEGLLSSRAQSKDKLNENIIANESNSRKEKSEIAEGLLSSRAQSRDKLNNNQKFNEINPSNNISGLNKSNEKITSNDEYGKIKPKKNQIEITANNNVLAKKQLALIENLAIKKDSISKEPNVLENLLAEKSRKKPKKIKPINGKLRQI